MPKGDDPKEAPPGLSPLDQLIYGAVFGHHGLPEWSKIAKDTTAYRFFSRWFTGPLQNPQANYYDALHGSLNQAARKIVGDFLQTVGKTSLSQLTKEEVKLLARQLLDSNAPGVQQFMTRLERLNPGSLGRLGGLINSINIGSGFVFLVPGQQQLLNYQTCGRSACGGSGPMF